jgi:hypothetical protein
MDNITLAMRKKLKDAFYSVKEFGAKGDNAHYDTLAINNAINKAYAVSCDGGGGKVFLPAGYYLLDASIIPKSRIEIFGVGWDTCIIPVSGGTFSPFYSDEVLAHLHIHDLRIYGNNNTVTAALELFMGYSILERIHITNLDGKGIFLCDPNVATNNGFLNRIKDNYIADITGIGVYLNYPCTDSWITGNNIGSTGYNLYTEGGPFRILHNHFDGSPSINWYHGGGTNIIFAHNIVENAQQQGIFIKHQSWDTGTYARDDISICNNIFRGNSQATTEIYDSIYIEGDVVVNGKGYNIFNNVFSWWDYSVKPQYAIRAKYAEDLQIVGNVFAENTYSGDEPIALDTSIENVKIRGNNNNKYVLLNSATPIINNQNFGTATIANGDTSVNVTHGLGETPSIQDISVTPTNSLGNAAKFWVSAVSSTTFTITVDADPGSDTAIFAWKANI